jgi:quaternary ammonium compound-resistance protein SugE
MSWIVLALSGVLEAVWATALGRSDGLSRPVPTIVFGVALAASMAGLGYAMRTIPIGTAYAVWVGIGAVLTVAVAVVSGDEPLTMVRAVFVTGIVVSVVGLKLAH